MFIQLALDRLTIDEAIRVADTVKEDVDWIEVGTSLIKEFGIESVRKLRAAFPEKVIVADIKTNDNAKYEWEMCFRAGADIATVMATAPAVTIETCMNTAERFGKEAMIDLLNAREEQIVQLYPYKKAIFCRHVGKDQQETADKASSVFQPAGLQAESGYRIAAAGGISLQTLPSLLKEQVYAAIVGSAITGASNPRESAKAINKYLKGSGTHG